MEKSLSCFVYYQPFIIYLERSARVKHHLTSKIYSPKQVIPKDPKKTPTLSTECRINMLRKMHMQTLSNSWTRQNPKNLIYFAWEEMPMIEKTSKLKWMNHDRKTQTQTPSPKNPRHSSDVNPSTVVLLHLCLQTIRQNPWKPSKGKFLEADNAASQQQRPTVLYSMKGSQLAD